MNAVYDAWRDASRWQLTGWLLVVAFVVFALVVDKVASTVFTIFSLAGLWLLIRRCPVAMDPVTRWVLLAFAAYFFIGVLSFFLGEQTRLGEKLLGRDIRFLGAVAAWFALAALALPRDLLRRAFEAGGIVTGLVALAEILLSADPDYRAGGRTISIVFGHLSAGLFAINLALLLFERRGRAWSVLAALLAAVAVILSGTRGAMISMLAAAVPGLVMVVAWRAGHVRKRNLFILLLLFAGLCAALSPWIVPRINEGVEQYRAYRDGLAAPRSDASRGCLADDATLGMLLAHSTTLGLEAAIVRLPEPLASCDGGAALRLSNASKKPGVWFSPYRNVPAATFGRVIAQGRGAFGVEGNAETVRVNSENESVQVELPATRQLDLTRFRVHLRAGEQILIVPVEVSPHEYAFAAAESSIGNRLDMWVATIRQLDFSLLGSGTGSWPNAMLREAEAGHVSWRLAAYDHAHSDYLTVLLERGWLGLLALFAALATPLLAAARLANGWQKAALMLFVVSTAVSALTETVFNHSIGITYYCFLVLLLMTASQSGTPDKGP